LPTLYEQLADDFREAYGGKLSGQELPRVVRFGSWIGGDSDGNPYVTNTCGVPSRVKIKLNMPDGLGN